MDWRLGPVLAIAGLALGFATGWKVHDWRDGAAQTKAVQHVTRVVQAQGSVSAAVGVAQQAAQDRVVYRTRTIIERVPTYVTAKADARCTVPRGFVSVLDSAAAGRELPAVPDGAAGSADADSGLALSAVSSSVAGNYGLCHQWQARVAGWESWYAGQRSAWLTK